MSVKQLLTVFVCILFVLIQASIVRMNVSQTIVDSFCMHSVRFNPSFVSAYEFQYDNVTCVCILFVFIQASVECMHVGLTMVDSFCIHVSRLYLSSQLRLSL